MEMSRLRQSRRLLLSRIDPGGECAAEVLADCPTFELSDGIWIDFPVSHTLLADMIGSSHETVTRALDQLQRSGFVVRRGHAYCLLVTPERLVGQNGAERAASEM
jgi:CRP-like cAMP-binding protein